MKKMTAKRWAAVAAAVVLVLLAAAAAWALWPNPQVAKVKELRKDLNSDAARKLPPEERRKKWEEFRAEQEKLSPTERREVWEEARKERQAEIDRYFTLSKEEKTQWLDRQIDRMEAMRRQWQANGGQQRPGNGQGGRNNLSSEEREKRRKERLDNSTPEQRAQRDQLRKDMDARRHQRGLGPVGGGFGGPR